MSCLRLRDVCLQYPIYGPRRRSLKQSLFNLKVGGAIEQDAHGNMNVLALRNITIEINDGDRVALIGRNGAGKSTLLRVLSGAYRPQRGEVETEGRVSTLFNVRLGMDPEATGYENIVLRGLVLGLTKNEITSRVNEIAKQSELDSFLDMPVRTYSDGMILRLAFAISTSINPDILLMDEWIGAGDEQFLENAQKRLLDLVSQSNILVLATHRLHLIQNLCNKAMLLDHGVLRCYGPVDDVIRAYKHQS